MTQQIRLWEITSDQTLAEIKGSQVPLEKNLEDWLESDISMLDSNLLVIGRQVQTDFGGIIDLLCIDDSGDLVVVELKKGRTPREVTAQALDYASWVKNLTSQQITEIAGEYLGDRGTLDDAFQDEFDQELPETLNASHRSLIVAEALDASTERIVQYLSELNVPINVLTVQQFQDSTGKRMLAQVYLVEPEIATRRSRSQSRRTSYRTVNELQSLADASGIGKLYGRVRSGVQGILSAQAYRKRVAYIARRENGSRRTVMIVSAVPSQDSDLPFTIHATRFQAILGIDLEVLKGALPHRTEDVSVSHWVGSDENERLNARGVQGSFKDSQEVDKFISLLRQGAAS